MRKILSVIIPVYNEADKINDAIIHIKKIEGTDKIIDKIIVVDGNKTNSTIDFINKEFENIKKIYSNKGRANQMNLGANESQSEILLFLHCDTRLEKGSFEDIINTIVSKNNDFGSFYLKFNNNSLMYRMLSFFTNIRTRLFKLPYGDQTFFVKNEVFRNVNGFSNVLFLEDVDFVKKIKKNGFKIGILKKYSITSDRKYKKEGFLKCLVKNRIIMFLNIFGVKNEILKKIYIRF